MLLCFIFCIWIWTCTSFYGRMLRLLLCLYLIFEVGMNLQACMDIFISVMAVIFICPFLVYVFGCVVFLIPC